jgi:hypothetical protein
MSVRSGLRIFLLAALLPALPAWAQERVRNHFDTDKPFGKPAFFDYMILNGEGPANWMIVPDPDHNPPSAPSQATQHEASRPAGSVAAAVRRTYVFQDGTASVAVKKQPGLAGLVLRMAGEKDYLLVLMDGEGSVKATATRGGKSTPIGQGRASLDRAWNVLSVVLSGGSVTVSVNAREVLAAVDPAPSPGRAGMATEGPGTASFDELILEIPK